MTKPPFEKECEDLNISLVIQKALEEKAGESISEM